MAPLGLAAPLTVFLCALLLFGTLVILRLVLDLLRRAKHLKEVASVATTRLKAAAREVQAEVDHASARAERIARRRR